MTAILKPIETRYKGYRFRSRLEARWAVFFDALGVIWEYEPQGYDLGPRGFYLPDFWLPDQQVWTEIKGADPKDDEREKAQGLADMVGRPVAILSGAIRDPVEEFYSRRHTDDDMLSLAHGEMFYPSYVRPNRHDTDGRSALYYCDDCRFFRVASLNDSDWRCNRCGEHVTPYHSRVLASAICAARSARFEHGETP